MPSVSSFKKAELIDRILKKVPPGWLEEFLKTLPHSTLDQMHDKLYPCDHPTIVQKGDSTFCPTCRKYVGGWWCPSSPDNQCHYFSEDGYITLRDGTQVPVPRGHDTEYETDDDCIFCHDPDERK